MRRSKGIPNAVTGLPLLICLEFVVSPFADFAHSIFVGTARPRGSPKSGHVKGIRQKLRLGSGSFSWHGQCLERSEAAAGDCAR
jgi:hypothetical protein